MFIVEFEFVIWTMCLFLMLGSKLLTANLYGTPLQYLALVFREVEK